MRPLTLPSGLRLNLAHVTHIEDGWNGLSDQPGAAFLHIVGGAGAMVLGIDRGYVLAAWDAWVSECAPYEIEMKSEVER